MRKLKKDLTNKRFGKLLVLSIHSRTRNKHIRWRCKCDCGNIHDVISTHLISGKITHCGCISRRGKTHKQWTGVGEISGSFWAHIKRSASSYKRREIEFAISKRYAWMIYLKQKGRCSLSGLPIFFKHTDSAYNSRTVSLDRIDSSKGYIEGNVQWVHKDINKMKNSFDEKYFINLCKRIILYSSGNCELI